MYGLLGVLLPVRATPPVALISAIRGAIKCVIGEG
jgi:hypothetical protein